MRKVVWAGAIVLVFVFVLVLGLSLFVKSYLTSEKIKSLIIPRAEEFTGRKLNIEQISVSLFKGIVLKDIVLKERDGEKDFIAAKEIMLDYSLIPLLKRQLVFKKIELMSPAVSLQRERDGKFNFDDIIEKSREQKGPSESGAQKEKAFPFAIITDRIAILDARVEFSDKGKEIPDFIAKADINAAVTAGKSLKDVAASGTLDLKELKANLHGIETSSVGKIKMDREAIQVNFVTTVLGKDTVKLSGTVKNYLNSPAIVLNVSAGQLDLESLMALGGGKRAVSAGQQEKCWVSEKTIQGKREKATEKITVSGNVTADSVRYKKYIIKGFALKYRYSADVMTIGSMQMQFSGSDQVTAAGAFTGKAQFRYPSENADVATVIKRTLTGKGRLDLTQCEVRQSKITDDMALVTGLNELRNPRFDSGEFQVTVRDQKVSLQGNLQSRQIILNPEGTVDFEERVNVLTDLELSPALAATLPLSGLVEYMKDEQGWSIVPLKITGTIEKPSVKLNAAALQRQVGKGIQRALEKQLLGEPPQGSGEQQPSSKSLQDIFKGIFGK